MMLDASALLAILMKEADDLLIAERIGAAEAPFTSPLAIYETVVRLMRVRSIPADEAEGATRDLLRVFDAKVVAITDDMTPLALNAFERYGRGRHPAALNFGDCFAYACARAHGAPLLYKGNDFARTDLA